jgi:maleylpyruvate isomerase
MSDIPALYGYFRSSAVYRVRIALNLKGVAHHTEYVHLRRNGGEQLSAAYRALNPQALVPAFAVDSDVMTQSLAIIEYLEERYPQPPLLPSSPLDRAYVRSLALSIACDIHPLNNLRVLQYLKKTLEIGDAQRDDWYRHWIAQGLSALEQRVARDARTGRFCYGDAPTMADVLLVPQVYNARRFDCPLDDYPTLTRICTAAEALDAFALAAPERQPDAEF